ncbi:MAG: helix-turn-helix domain-containing protein [Oxalobacteraceae bacterium]|nr:MAG: helix-turn-helix domain-containing protein [Oxalobacteraceae bacterium]
MTTDQTRGAKICLSVEDEAALQCWQRISEVSGPQARRARILQLLGRGLRQCDVARQIGAGIATVGRVRRRFILEGLEPAVFGYVSTGAPRLLSTSQEAKVVALACSNPPVARARWSVRLLATECVRRGHVDRVARETVRLILKHHGIKPWREKNVVCPETRHTLPAAHGRHFRAVRATCRSWTTGYMP